MHIIDTGWAGRHTGQARKATVDMLYRVGRNLISARQHLLDQIDAPARTVELVTEQDIGRASRRAKAAMGAGTQNFFGFGNVGISKLLGREVGPHSSVPFDHAAAIED